MEPIIFIICIAVAGTIAIYNFTDKVKKKNTNIYFIKGSK